MASSGRPLKPPRRRRGVALLTVLLITFLASTAAVGLASLQQAGIRQSTLLEQRRQARWYLLGAEQWARQLLRRDRDDSDSDHGGEPWARLPPALAVPGGAIGGSIADLQGRLNLNNLAADDVKLAARTLARLQRLLELLGLAPELAQAIADWVDDDQQRRFPGGAEDGDYLLRDPAYLSANRPLTSLSELRLIGAVDDEAYRRLRPHLAALPAPSKINVNTASAELLAALFEGLDPTLMTRLVETRARQPFAALADFTVAAGLQDELARLDANGDNAAEHLADLDVNSDYFLLRSSAEVGDARAGLYSMLFREQGRVRVLMRSFGSEW